MPPLRLTHRPALLAPALFAIGLLATPAQAGAETIFDDDFDDGILDPAWEITLECADGFTGVEAGSTFTVTDIDSVCIDGGETVDWSKLILRRGVPPTADFRVAADFTWAEADESAMQTFRVKLWDASEDLVAEVSFYDAWYDWTGSSYAYIAPDFVYYPGLQTAPLSGSASVELLRTGCDVTIVWNGVTILTGETTSLIDAVTLEFGYYAFVREFGTSHFGTEAIDRIVFDGAPSADADGDGNIGLGDLLLVLSSWGECPDPPELCPGDVTGDDVVDLADLLRILSGWGVVCP